MKTLTAFFSKNPSYIKCGNSRIAQRTGLKESTVARFKKGTIFAQLSNEYRKKK